MNEIILNKSAVAGTYEQHVEFCSLIGIEPAAQYIQTMPERFKESTLKHHIVYWALRIAGYDNVTAEQYYALLNSENLIKLA